MLNRKQILGVIFVVFLCISFAEFILRIFFPISLELSCRKEMLQNLSGLKKHIVYERNKFGFRSLSMKTREKPPRTVRIICLGASATDQATHSTEDTWSGVLEKELNQAFKIKGIKIEVAAYGRGGDTVVDTLSWAKSNLMQFQPDIVITLVGINDLCFLGGPGYVYKGLPDRFEANQPQYAYSIIGIIKHRYLQSFQLYRRLRVLKHKLCNWWAFKSGKAVSWCSQNISGLRKEYRDLPYVAKPVRKTDPIFEFSDGMSALLKFLTRSGIEVIVIAQPVLWKEKMSSEEMDSLWMLVKTPHGPVRPDVCWLEKEFSRYNRVQRRLAENFKATYVNLDQDIPKTLQYFLDDCHFTNLGSQLVAYEIYPVVKEHIATLLRKRN